jgi:DNA-directed RNA polymerase subunit omega
LIYPSADIIEERVGSRYSLVVLAAKRAKQIKEGAPVLIETLSTNPLTVAMEEIAAGKVTVSQAEVAPVEAQEASGSTVSLEDRALSISALKNEPSSRVEIASSAYDSENAGVEPALGAAE